MEALLYSTSRNLKTEAPGSPLHRLNNSGCGVGGISKQQQHQLNDSGSRASYMCRKCRAHGKLTQVKRHKRTCPFNGCICQLCELVNQGRHIVAKQIALYRDQRSTQAAKGGRGNQLHPNGNNSLLHHQLSPSTMMNSLSSSVLAYNSASRELNNSLTVDGDDGPHCRKCRNHGITSPWKGHKKKCPYRHCACQQCSLIALRKSNEKLLREMVLGNMEESIGHLSSSHRNHQLMEQCNTSFVKNPLYSQISANIANNQCLTSHHSSLMQHESIKPPPMPWVAASAMYHTPNITGWDNCLYSDNQAMSYAHPAYNTGMLMSSHFGSSGISQEHSNVPNPWNFY